MKFSFILPAWKGRYLREAIQSILNQSYCDFELIVVDDCSPEALEKIVGAFHDPRIEYHRNERNIGGRDLVAQWNHCLQYAHGDYVILATDDDLYEPDFLEEMSQLIDTYPAVELLRARILQVNADNHIMGIDRCYKEHLTKDEFVYHMLHGMKGGIPQYVFRRQALIDKGGFVNFPKAWASDDATAIMMAEHGVATTQEHLVRFRWSDINISSDKRSIVEKVQARLHFYHWLRQHLLPIKPVDEETAFLHNNIDDFLPIYNKVTLLAHLAGVPLLQKLQCLRMIAQCDDMSSRDRLSVIVRSLL